MRLRKLSTLCLLCLMALYGVGCSPDASKKERQEKEAQEERARQEELEASQKELLRALPRDVTYPADNPYSVSKVELGRLLFFDPILSGGKDVACATCHHPSTGYAEFRDLPIGVNGVGQGSRRTFKSPNDIPFTKRNAPSVLNTAFNGIQNFKHYDPMKAPMFWDLRATSLERQMLKPMQAFEEMRGHAFGEQEILGEIERRLQAIPEYERLFRKAFDESHPVTITNVTRAIATYERQLVTTDTRFDQYKRGSQGALSLAEKHGLETFIKVGCAKCHNGPMLSDFEPHVLGVPHHDKLAEKDLGFNQTHAFRTPSLRNLRYTAPYMHNGSISTLEKVLEFYEDMALRSEQRFSVPFETLDVHARAVTLKTRDIGPILAFLKALDAEHFDQRIPERVPSGLQVGGNLK